MNEEQNYKLGLTVNWARSAIEGRKIEMPEKHVQLSTKSGVLSGVMFSGVTEKTESLYGAWRDIHAPPAKSIDMQHYVSTSLMTFPNVKNTLKSCDVKKLIILASNCYRYLRNYLFRIVSV